MQSSSGLEDATRVTLLERLREPNDHKAWREFDQRYGELIARYARKRGASPCEAEDVSQTVLMALMKTLPRFQYDRNRGRFRDYLGTMVRHAVLRQTRPRDEIRSDSWISDRMSNLSEGYHAYGHDPNDPWEREWMDYHLRRAIWELRGSVETRSIAVFEALMAGASLNEVAKQFNSNTEAVRRTRSRIRKRIQAIVETQTREEERLWSR